MHGDDCDAFTNDELRVARVVREVDLAIAFGTLACLHVHAAIERDRVAWPILQWRVVIVVLVGVRREVVDEPAVEAGAPREMEIMRAPARRLRRAGARTAQHSCFL